MQFPSSLCNAFHLSFLPFQALQTLQSCMIELTLILIASQHKQFENNSVIEVIHLSYSVAGVRKR